ncbi:MAG: O-antigen ligase family protein, partial [Thermodesulfovibrionales bacterium]
AITIPIPYNLLPITLIPLLAIFYYKPILGLLLLIVFLPDYPLILFSVGRADITLFECAFFIAFFSWILLCIRDNKIRFYGSTIDISLLLIFSWVLFSLFWTVSLDRGIFQVLKIIPSLITYYLFIHMIRDKEDFNVVLSAWLIIAVFITIIGFFETVIYGINAASQLVVTEAYTHLTRGVRAEALFTSPDTLGLVLSLTITLVIIKYMTTPSKGWKAFLIIFLPVMFFVFVATFSRKSYLSVAAALIFMSLRYRKILLWSLGITATGFILTILLATGGFMEALLNRFQTYFMSPEVTISGRWVAWHIGLQLFSESPITGKGIGSFFVSAQILESPLNITHNFYVYVLAELGIIGFALVIFWYFQIAQSFYVFFRQSTNESEKIIAMGIASGLLVLLIQSFFRTFMFTDPLFWGFLGISSAFLKVYSPIKGNDATLPSDTKKLLKENDND